MPPGRRKKGEVALLHCDHCQWSTEVPLEQTVDSTVVPCSHCGARIYWHRCPHCDLCYAGRETPACPSCDDGTLDELEPA